MKTPPLFLSLVFMRERKREGMWIYLFSHQLPQAKEKAMAKKEKKRRRKQGRYLNRTQVEEGLYLDVEGYAPGKKSGPRPPVLCGHQIGSDGPVIQTVFTRDFVAAAEASGLETSTDRKAFFLNLMKETQGRKLFAFSEHEQKVIKQATTYEYRKKYRNVHVFAMRWMKREFPGQSTRGLALVDYLHTADIKVPVDYGKDKVTEWLREVAQHSSSKTKWKKAPASARKAWENILAHNRFDVTSMAKLIKVVSQN